LDRSIESRKEEPAITKEMMEEKKKQKIYLPLSGTDIEEKMRKIFHKNTNYKDLKNTQKGGK